MYNGDKGEVADEWQGVEWGNVCCIAEGKPLLVTVGSGEDRQVTSGKNSSEPRSEYIPSLVLFLYYYKT